MYGWGVENKMTGVPGGLASTVYDMGGDRKPR
jgi:hypothetical protein